MIICSYNFPVRINYDLFSPVELQIFLLYATLSVCLPNVKTGSHEVFVQCRPSHHLFERSLGLSCFLYSMKSERFDIRFMWVAVVLLSLLAQQHASIHGKQQAWSL